MVMELAPGCLSRSSVALDAGQGTQLCRSLSERRAAIGTKAVVAALGAAAVQLAVLLSARTSDAVVGDRAAAFASFYRGHLGNGEALRGAAAAGSAALGQQDSVPQGPAPAQPGCAGVAVAAAAVAIATSLRRAAPARRGFQRQPARGVRSVRRAVKEKEVSEVAEEVLKALEEEEDEEEQQVQELLKGDESADSCYRSQRLKDMVYVKEMRAAITSGEFALRLRGVNGAGVMDFQSLCNRFYNFAEKLERQPLDPEVLRPHEAKEMMHKLQDTRERLEERVMEIVYGGGVSAASTPPTPHPAEAEALNGDTPPVELPDPRRLLLYLREDGTVDSEGALNEASKAARFSSDLWSRLNGRDTEDEEENTSMAEPKDDPRAQRRLLELQEAKRKYENAMKERSAVLQKAAPKLSEETASERDHLVRELRQELRDCEQNFRESGCRVLLAEIDWLLERAAAALEADLERASVADWDVTGRQLKLFVVEFTLLDKQAASYRQFVPEDPDVCIGQECIDFTGVLDPEELRVLGNDVSEYMTRLGLQVQRGETESFEKSVKTSLVQLKRTYEKVKGGLAFYVNGANLFGQDLQYAGSLFSKAALSNYTLQPREVRTIERTVKDCAVMVPFLIILIIPLTPVGHVLIFSFIQKFFPDFFPSTFTERRQSVMRIYRDIVPDVEKADVSGVRL